jgi:hypothetical protein
VLITILGPNRDEVIGGWRYLQNGEINSSYPFFEYNRPTANKWSYTPTTPSQTTQGEPLFTARNSMKPLVYRSCNEFSFREQFFL